MTVKCLGPGCGREMKHTDRGRTLYASDEHYREFVCENPTCDVERAFYLDAEHVFVKSLKYLAWRAESDARVFEVHTTCDDCGKCHSCVTANKSEPKPPCFPKGIVAWRKKVVGD